MLDLPATTPVKEQFFEVARRWQTFPVPVERVETAPFYEHEITDQIDLFHLFPLFRLNEYDGGCYIDKACIITKDLVVIPQASVVPLDPGSHPPGITHKIIMDATTPTAPDIRGEFTQPLQSPPDADKWEHILSNLWKKEGYK